MANNSVAGLLLKKAWEQLWKPGTPYYLPTALMSGASGGGKTVPRLGARPVPDLGPFGLFGDSTFGEVNLSLRGASAGGFSSGADGGFTYVDATQTFTATINFSRLTLTGKYDLTGNGILGSALVGASDLMHLIPSATVRTAEADQPVPGDDPRLDIAKQYRDQLVDSSAGLEMVGSYYDHNWAMNEVVRGDNVFTGYMKHQQARSSAMADQTTAAAAAPTDPTKTVGDDQYFADSMMRQLVFEKACRSLSKSDDDPFAEAAAATNDFKAAVVGNYGGPVTVGAVMQTVQQAPAARVKASAAAAKAMAMAGEEMVGDLPVSLFRTPEAVAGYRKALAEADAFIAAWEAEKKPCHTFTDRLSAGDMQVGSGTFNNTFAAPNFVVTGTVTISGPLANPTLSVKLTGVAASMPSISIDMGGSGGWSQGNLYDRVAQALANARFIHDLIGTKLNHTMSDPSVLSYLSERINDSITQALGSL